MSTVLAIETSVSQASLVLHYDGENVIVDTFNSERGHNSAVFAPLENALRWLDSRQQRLDHILIGTGPGSYSGTRIGIAAAQGVSLARGCGIAGLGSLGATSQARAAIGKNAPALAVGDARRGLFYTVEIAHNGTATDATLTDKDTFIEKLHANPDATLFTLDSPDNLGLPDNLLARLSPALPEAQYLIDIWLELDNATRSTLSDRPISPAYLRPPFTSKAKSGHPLLRQNPT